MKKILSIIIALVMMMSVVALVACDNSETYTGEYSYTAYGMTYGAKVDVVMTGDTISNIRLYTDEETGWVGLSDAYPDYGWTDEARQVWLDGVNNLMLSFVGMTADEVAAIDATIAGVNGTADSVDSDYMITGATQSSARLVLAIQNAICGGDNTPIMTYTGSYSYEAYGTTYGVKLDVTTVDGKITNIELYSDSETGWVGLSDAYPDYGWTEDNRDNWTDNLDSLLESFYGMTADEVGAISATIAGVVGDGDAVDDNYMITGATQGSARVVLALQNALCGGPDGVVEDTTGGVVTADGTYTGSASSSFASIEVSVVVTDGKVASVTISGDSTTNTNYSHLVTDSALATLTDSFVGMTPAEIVAVESAEVTTTGNATGDHVITGATVSSNTVLEAVQDALTLEGTSYTGSYTGTIIMIEGQFDVTVVVADDKVTSITLADGTHTTGSPYEGYFTTELDDLIDSLVGLTVTEVLAISEASADKDYTNDDYTVTSGATVSSNGVLFAVQDALSKIAD